MQNRSINTHFNKQETNSMLSLITMEWLMQWLWQDKFWLPPGIRWADMERALGSRQPLPRDLIFALPLALCFITLRYIFERHVALPLSRALGVKDKVRLKVPPAPNLEEFYCKTNRQPSQNEMVCLVKQCDWSLKQVENWFRKRRNQDRPSTSKKFCEACWRFVFYLLSFSAGWVSLVRMPWFWDQRECWRGFPHQEVQQVHYWYYMLQLSFYCSLLLCVTIDTKRKDYKEQIIHHLTTIFLLCFSYCSNYIRIGCLVLLLHDCSDVLLESAKMLNYAGWRRTCDSLFVLFAVVFLFTRLLLFPCKIMYTTLVLSMDVFTPFVGYYFFNLLLLLLQLLHLYWAFLILTMVHKLLSLGKLEKDERSDVESEEEEELDKSWRKWRKVLDPRSVMISSSCVLNSLNKQNIDGNTPFPKAR